MTTGALSLAERSHPTSKVRGRSREDPMPEGSGQEELPHVRGQGQQLRVPDCDGTGTAEKSYLTSKVRGSGWEDQPHVQGAMAAWAQESLEVLFHFEGEEGRW